MNDEPGPQVQGHVKRRRTLLVAFSVAVGVGLAAGGLLAMRGSGDDAVCRQASGAEVCLIPRGHAYRVEGTGFAPASDVQIVWAAEPALMLRTDGQGRFPQGGGVAGFLPGEQPTVGIVTGTSKSGEPVRLEVTACGVSASGGRIC